MAKSKVTEKVVQRDNRGRIVKGQVLNPGGKPKILPPKLNERLIGLIDDNLEDVLRVVIDAAKAGDMTAAGLLLNRRIPTVKPAHQPIAFEMVGDTPVEQAESVVRSMASGVLSVTDGTAVIQMLLGIKKIAESETTAQEVVYRIEGGSGAFLDH